MTDDETLPLLPYAGTSGWSGSDTSHERAVRADNDGTTARRQAQMLTALDRAGARGMTAAELCDHYDLRTNSVAPALSVLHKEGRIARVKERRGRHEIYVLPEHVNGREVAAPGRHGVTPPIDLGEFLDEFLADRDAVRKVALKVREHARVPGFWRQECGAFGCGWVDQSEEQHPVHHDEHIVQVTVEAIREATDA